MCCHVEKVGVELQDEALAMAHNAVRATFLQDVQKNLRRGSRKAAAPMEPENVIPVLRVAVPADGRCCWHALVAATKLEEYQRVPRYSSGYAINRRQVQEEEQSARDLMHKAVALCADKEGLAELVDVPALHVVGRALDLAIRCTVHESVPWQLSPPLVMCV